MPNYRVRYAFERHDSAIVDPETDRYGFGVIVVNTDKEPQTPEEMKEIARFIGTMRHEQKTEDYLSVGILEIFDTDLDLDADKRTVMMEQLGAKQQPKELFVSGEDLVVSEAVPEELDG